MTESINSFYAIIITDDRKLECKRGCVGGVQMANNRAERTVRSPSEPPPQIAREACSPEDK